MHANRASPHRASGGIGFHACALEAWRPILLACASKAALAGRTGRRMEVEARGATVLLRTLVLRPHGELAGAAVLVRDVTEVKRRDRALLSKDATRAR